MKYTMLRKFTFKNKNFEVVRDSKLLCTVKTEPSKEYKNRYEYINIFTFLPSQIWYAVFYRVKFSNIFDREYTCSVEPDPNLAQGYLIYLTDNKTMDKRLFAQLIYQLVGTNDYLYTIVIGQKLYQVRSSDLMNRHLTIVDTMQTNDSSRTFYPETLFEVLDSFSKSTEKYHILINDYKCQYAYLAIVVLFYLHECTKHKSWITMTGKKLFGVFLIYLCLNNQDSRMSQLQENNFKKFLNKILIKQNQIDYKYTYIMCFVLSSLLSLNNTSDNNFHLYLIIYADVVWIIRTFLFCSLLMRLFNCDGIKPELFTSIKDSF